MPSVVVPFLLRTSRLISRDFTTGLRRLRETRIFRDNCVIVITPERYDVILRMHNYGGIEFTAALSTKWINLAEISLCRYNLARPPAAQAGR